MNLPNLKEIDQIRQSGFRPQIVGCFLCDRKILFLYKEEYKLWQLPQGGIDNRENIEQATTREMTEELGSDFFVKTEIDSLVGFDQIEFPNSTKNSRELKTDTGEEIFMEGKKYFFIAIKATKKDLSIEKTEFDNYKWLDYEQAMELTKSIYQKGKKRITIYALKKLRGNKLL